MKETVIYTTKQFDPSDQEARKNIVGSSDAPVITRTAPYQNQIHNTWKGLWNIKTGRSLAPDLSENQAVQWGIDMEDTVRMRAKKHLGIELRKATETFFHKKYPFICAHPDSVIKGIKEIGEIKCPGMGTMMKMGENLENFLDSYKAQGIHQLLVMDKMKAVQFYVQYPQKRLKVYRMERDDRAIDNYLQLVLAFWELVEKDIPPEPQTEVEANETYFKHNKEYMAFNPKVAETIRKIMDIEQNEKELDKEKKALRLEVKKSIGKYAGMEWDYTEDNVQVQRHPRRTFNEDSFFEHENEGNINDYSIPTIDKNLLKRENEELYNKHCDITQVTRLVLPKK